MQTGYDSFWMYQNNRHEPALNLQKNDNQSHAVLTDSYKQVPNGGHPSLMNSCIPPQSNIARSHANDQHRTPHPQYMWPSSVYSMPLKPSYVSNFHTQAAFSTQSNNSGYSSHYTQQTLSDRSDSRNFQNPNTSVSQVLNRNSNSSSTLIRDNQNSNAHTARIRVRDVFSLNKGTVSNEVLNSSSYQKQQHRYFNYNSAYNTDNQSQFVNYDRGNLPQSNHLPPYYPTHQMASHPTAPGLTQQLHQNSASFCQQNPESQHQFAPSRPVDRNLNFEPSKINVQNVPAPQELLSPRSNQDPCRQNNMRIPSGSVRGNEIVQVAPKRNSVQGNNSERAVNPGYRDSLNVNNNLTSESSILSNIQNEDNTCPFRNNSSSASTTASVRSPVYQHSGGQETVIKISIPQIGQSTFITLSDCGSTNKSSGLPYSLDGSDKLFSEWDKNNPKQSNSNKENSVVNVSMPQTRNTGLSNPQTPPSASLPSPNTTVNVRNSESGYRKNLTVPPRKRFCPVKEPFLNLNKENFHEFLNSPLSENGSDVSLPKVRKSEIIARETTFQEKITMNALEVKQEHLNARVENPALDADISEKKKVLFEIIKREKIPANENAVDGAEQSGESNLSQESLTSDVEFTEYSSVDVKEFGYLPETPEPEGEVAEDWENRTERVENSNNSTAKRKTSSTENKQGRQEKRLPPELNYKSRINRNKLDKLIKFLEMDEGSVESTRIKGRSKQEVDLNHNRRKISKTSIVKNRNNSREMISMMKPNKNARVEPPKCSPPAPRSAKPNPENVREGRNSTDEKHKGEQKGNAAETHVKSNPPRVTPAEDSSEKSEPKSMNGCAGTTSSEECKRNCCNQKVENITNRIRALQTLETLFCGNCDLVSSLNSFWINVASGELRCSNCFKKVTLESKENYTTSSVGKRESVESVRKERIEKRTENNRENAVEGSVEDFRDANRAEGPSETECMVETLRSVTAIKQEPIESIDLPMYARKETTVEELLKGSNVKEDRQIKHSEDKSKDDMKYGKLKRKDSVSKENRSAPNPLKEGSASLKAISSTENQRKDQSTDQSLRKSISKEHCDTGKKQENIRKSIHKEEEIAEEHAKKDKKSAECSSQMRQRSDSKDFVFCKSPEEHSKKETKSIVDSTDKSVKKTKECHPTQKDSSAEQTTKKSSKHEHSEKGKFRSPSKERATGHKPKESDSSEEFRTKNTTSVDSSEKHKKIESTGQARKRKNSDEDPGPVKVRIVEDQGKKEMKPVQQRISTSKDNIECHKTVNNETQTIRNSSKKGKSNCFSKEEREHVSNSSEALKVNGNYQKIKAYEQAKQKTGELTEALKVDANYQKIKAYEQAKQKAGELTETLRRKSKEEQLVHKHTKTEAREATAERRKSKEDVDKRQEFGEPEKHWSPPTENKERKKTEEKEKKNHSSRKSDTASRPLKENQNTEVKSTKNKLRNEHRKNSGERKDDKREKETSEQKARKELESSSEKQKCWDRLVEKKSEKIQTENRHEKALERAAERCSGGKTDDGALTKARKGKDSATLFSKLLEKTKKLSRSLLADE